MGDLTIPDKFAFHDWYKEAYGVEYPHNYTTMYRILTDQEKHDQKKEVIKLINEWHKYLN